MLWNWILASVDFARHHQGLSSSMKTEKQWCALNNYESKSGLGCCPKLSLWKISRTAIIESSSRVHLWSLQDGKKQNKPLKCVYLLGWANCLVCLLLVIGQWLTLYEPYNFIKYSGLTCLQHYHWPTQGFELCEKKKKVRLEISDELHTHCGQSLLHINYNPY